MNDETDDFEVSLLYGEEMSSYTYFGPICENCKTENNFFDKSKAHSSNEKCLFCNKKSANNYFKTGSQSHQICINNNFSNKWEKIKGWYMGCIFLKCEKFGKIDINILKLIFKQVKKNQVLEENSLFRNHVQNSGNVLLAQRKALWGAPTAEQRL